RPYVTEITTQERERLRTLARENGVEIAAIHWVLAKTEGFHVTHPDPAVRRKTIGYLRALVQFGIEIGAQAMVVGSPAQRRLLEDVTYSEAWKWFAEAMAAAASEGAGTGFKICIEPLAPDTDNNFLFKTSEVVKMVQEIGMPNCGVIIDTYSASRTEEDIPAAIRLAGPHLMHYHCNDLNKRAPGWGRVDFVPIFDALLDIRFAGYCSIEVFDFSIEPREHAGKGLQFLRDALAEAMSRRRR
ncbi:MAG: sugar phosphate isomerase/epimerase, partial [Armatimonadetes bacterium]|nr:sugar phosphate isomerase/epimerase [Armatimonadota bacterium]